MINMVEWERQATLFSLVWVGYSGRDYGLGLLWGRHQVPQGNILTVHFCSLYRDWLHGLPSLDLGERVNVGHPLTARWRPVIPGPNQMLFPLLPFVFTQVQCRTVEKEHLASSLGSLSRESRGFGEPSCWIAARIEFFLKFLFWAAGRRLPTLGCGRTCSSTLSRRPRPPPPPPRKHWLKRHLWKFYIFRTTWDLIEISDSVPVRWEKKKLFLFWKIGEIVVI